MWREETPPGALLPYGIHIGRKGKPPGFLEGAAMLKTRVQLKQ
jgi:hypothetical protein